MTHLEATGTHARVAAFKTGESFTLKIGSDRFSVDSLTLASILYQELRDGIEAACGPGAERLPEGALTGEGRVYRVSYNGRIWEGSVVVMEAA